MTMQNCSKKWTAIGRKYVKQGQFGRPSDPTDIPIKEQDRSVSMDDKKEAYGQPIDARLGIYLIRNLFDKLDDHHLLNLLFDSEETESEEDSKKHTRDLKKWLKKLLWYSRAITIDKNIILKILSQPLCEGLRFYLCLTPPKGATSTTDPFAGNMSFVTVGVNCLGKDLNYNLTESLITAGNDVPDVETTSLVGEYGHPPGNGPSNFDVAAESPYVLWEYAMQQHNKNTIG
jgi:hypothetical protein